MLLKIYSNEYLNLSRLYLTRLDKSKHNKKYMFNNPKVMFYFKIKKILNLKFNYNYIRIIWLYWNILIHIIILFKCILEYNGSCLSFIKTIVQGILSSDNIVLLVYNYYCQITQLIIFLFNHSPSHFTLIHNSADIHLKFGLILII